MRLETVGLWIAIAGAITVAAIGYSTTEALATTSKDVDRTHETIEALDEVLVAVGRAGSARRSFLLGGEDLEIQKFEAASEDARGALSRARSLIVEDGGGADRLDRIEPLLERRLSEQEESIDRRSRGLDTRAEAPTRAEVEQMDTLRSIIVGATDERRGVLRDRGRRATATATVARAVDLSGTGLSIAILILAFTSLRRDAARERAARSVADRATRFLDSIVEHLPAMVFLKEARSLKFERVNRAAEDLLGVSRQDLIGKSDWDFFPSEQASFFQAKDRQTLERGLVVDIDEEPIETKRGRLWLHTRKVPLFDAEGRPAFLLGISVDITARKRSAADLKEAKDKAEALNRDLETFSYSVAHDLRAPLRSIDGFSRALLEDCGPSLGETGQAHLKRVLAAAQRMAVLIDDMLTLSRLSRADVQFTEVDVSAMAAESVASLLQGLPARDVCLRIAPSLRTRGDPRLLRIVLDNLLGNALKFTGGRTRATIEVGMAIESGEPVFYVRDDGVGFDSRYADKLFGPFQRLHSTRDFPGTGIGLATVQRVVRRHGGRVWAHGEVDQGATFSFTLGGREQADGASS
jgi:PAS domain S-box-containing protein